MYQKPPTVDPTLYEGGTCDCLVCGQATVQMRRFDPEKPKTTECHLRCFTCNAVTRHRQEWDGVTMQRDK